MSGASEMRKTVSRKGEVTVSSYKNFIVFWVIQLICLAVTPPGFSQRRNVSNFLFYWVICFTLMDQHKLPILTRTWGVFYVFLGHLFLFDSCESEEIPLFVILKVDIFHGKFHTCTMPLHFCVAEICSLS